MPTLKETIDAQLKQSMKDRQEVKVSTLRLIRSGVKYKEIEDRKPCDDEGVIQVIKKMVKQAYESIEQFKKGNRQDLVQKTEQELAILEPMLPKMLSSEELKSRIEKIIKECGVTSPKQMGEVMKKISQSLGAQADMKEASRIVRDVLSGA